MGDNIGTGFCSYFQACEQKLSKQFHYDFGLRNHLSLSRMAGKRLRENNDWSNEKQSMANLIAEIQNLRLTAEDREISNGLLVEHLCEVTAQKQMSIGEKVAFMASVRHGVAVMVGSQSVENLRTEIDAVMNATSTHIPYALTDEAFSVTNGNVVQAMRQSVKETGNFNIYFSGEQKVQPCHYFENLNTVLDDNRVLVMEET